LVKRLNGNDKAERGEFMSEEHSALKNHFLKIFRHMKWSDISLLKLLEGKNISEGKVVELISHIVIAEDTWYKRITNEFYDNKFWNILSIEECRILVESTNLKFIDFIFSLSENDFQKKISYKNSKGIDYITSIEDIFTHVAFHGMYHRGQIMLLMRNAGQDVVATDYAMYIREHEYGEK
jgi:uncharacterized damage-inducible protein DinB